MLFVVSSGESEAPRAKADPAPEGQETDATPAVPGGEPAEAAEPSDPAASSEPAEPSEPAAKPAEPADASEPADAGEPADAAKPAEPVDVLLRRFLSLPPIQVTAPPPPDPLVNRTASTLPAPARTPGLESFDQKLAEVEPLLATGNWDGIIGVLSKQQTLPPPLALIYAVALKERAEKGNPEGLAIRSVAALLCVPVNSETALVVAKRLLRTNPVAWQKRSAPSTGVSVGIALAVAVLGALIGFLAGPGTPLLR